MRKTKTVFDFPEVSEFATKFGFIKEDCAFVKYDTANENWVRVDYTPKTRCFNLSYDDGSDPYGSFDIPVEEYHSKKELIKRLQDLKSILG